jgi:pilus assembly protein Flp/PilA
MLRLLMLVQSLAARPLRRDDRGVTSVEYGLLVALIAVGIVAAVGSLRTAVAGVFSSMASALGGV